MSSQYPTGIDEFTTKLEGHTIEPSHVNDLQEAIVEIEQILGTNITSGAVVDMLQANRVILAGPGGNYATINEAISGALSAGATPYVAATQYQEGHPARYSIYTSCNCTSGTTVVVTYVLQDDSTSAIAFIADYTGLLVSGDEAIYFNPGSTDAEAASALLQSIQTKLGDTLNSYIDPELDVVVYIENGLQELISVDSFGDDNFTVVIGSEDLVADVLEHDEIPERRYLVLTSTAASAEDYTANAAVDVVDVGSLFSSINNATTGVSSITGLYQLAGYSDAGSTRVLSPSPQIFGQWWAGGTVALICDDADITLGTSGLHGGTFTTATNPLVYASSKGIPIASAMYRSGDYVGATNNPASAIRKWVLDYGVEPIYHDAKSTLSGYIADISFFENLEDPTLLDTGGLGFENNKIGIKMLGSVQPGGIAAGEDTPTYMARYIDSQDKVSGIYGTSIRRLFEWSTAYIQQGLNGGRRYFGKRTAFPYTLTDSDPSVPSLTNYLSGECCIPGKKTIFALHANGDEAESVYCAGTSGTAFISATTSAVTSVVLTSTGSTYWTKSTAAGVSGFATNCFVRLIGGGGSGATARVVLSGGAGPFYRIQDVVIDAPGTGYSSPPRVQVYNNQYGLPVNFKQVIDALSSLQSSGLLKVVTPTALFDVIPDYSLTSSNKAVCVIRQKDGNPFTVSLSSAITSSLTIDDAVPGYGFSIEFSAKAASPVNVDFDMYQRRVLHSAPDSSISSTIKSYKTESKVLQLTTDWQTFRFVYIVPTWADYPPQARFNGANGNVVDIQAVEVHSRS